MSEGNALPPPAARFFVDLVLGGLLGLAVRELYKRWGGTPSNREEFGNLFPLFTMATLVVISVVRQSVALSLGLLGAVSVVRYRTAIKSPEELVYLLFCVAVGLALGAGQPGIAMASVPIVAVFIGLGKVARPDGPPPSPPPRAGRDGGSRARRRPASRVFTLVPSPPDRGDVDVSRREIKFGLPYADADKLRAVLDVNCRRISHRGPNTLVSTIYFDDPLLTACREHLDGVPQRVKVRLRWYDDDILRRGLFFFEIKRRVYSMVRKERWMIRSQTPLTELTFPQIRDELEKTLPSPALESFLSRPEPVLITQYRREYFRSLGRSTRVTLDAQIVTFSQMGRARPGKRFGSKEPDLVILEAKAPETGGDEIREMLHPLEPQVTKSSKYVRGCLRLGLVPGGDVS